MSNYFTKESALKIALNTQVPFSSNDEQYIFNTAQIQALMNLAVETAIGEPVRYQRFNPTHGWVEVSVEDLAHYEKMKQDVRELYSVKELDN